MNQRRLYLFSGLGFMLAGAILAFTGTTPWPAFIAIGAVFVAVAGSGSRKT